jgi:hypothetical protein
VLDAGTHSQLAIACALTLVWIGSMVRLVADVLGLL